MTTHDDERRGLPSASGAERLYQCPGSLRAERAAPEGTPTDEALEGTEIHEAMESDDFSGLQENGKTIAENLLRMRDEAKDEFVRNTGDEPIVSLKEDRLWIRDHGRPIASAKLDWALVGANVGMILDWKTGYLEVTKAYRNIQVRWQALALWSEYPQLTRIAAGTAQYRFKGGMDFVDYDVSLLQKSKQELEFKLWMAEQEHASFNPGEWCKKCKARGLCKAAAAYSLLPMETAADQVAAKLTEKDLTLELINRMTPQQMAFMVRRSSTITNVLDEIKTRMKALPAEVLKEVGFQLGKPVQVRQLPDAGKLWQHIWDINRMYSATENLVTLEEFQGTLKAGLGKVEELLTEKLAFREGIGKKEAKAKAAKLLEPVVTYKENQPRLNEL